VSVVANVAINVDAGNAVQQLNRVDAAAKGTQKGFDAAGLGAKGFGAALQASLGPLIAFTTAAETVRKSLETAFARGAAEQRLKNLTGSTKEFETATALAANAADQFGLTQTQATEAFADAYGRLSGLGYGLKEVNDIYSGFNVVAKQAGVSSEDAAGSFLQLSQAMGKGVLNGDELAIILERMPQLGTLLAKEMGVGAGSIKQLGSEGKITGDVIYRALEQASSSAGELGSNLNAQQKTFAELSQVADQLFNSLGEALGPVVIAGAQLLAKAGEILSDRWNYVANVLFPQVVKAIEPLRAAIASAVEGIDFSVITTVIQNVLIKGFQAAVGIIGNFSKVLAFVITKFKELSNNPVFKFIADQVGRLLNSLGLTTNHVVEYKKEQEGAAQATAKNVKEFSKLPPQAVDLKAKQAAVKAELSAQLAVLAQQKQINEQNNQLIDSRRNLLSGLNQIDQQRFSTQLKYALSFEQELGVLNQIQKAKLQANKLDEESANIQAQRNIDNAYIAAEEAKLKAQAAAADLKALDVNAENYNLKKLELETIINGAAIAERGIGVAYEVAQNTREAAAAKREQADAAARQEISEQRVAAFAAEAARQSEAFNRSAQEASNYLSNTVKQVDAIAQSQITINNAQIQSLTNNLKTAETDGERVRILSKIRNLEVANAGFTLLATRAQITAEVERQRIAMDVAEVKYKELQAVVQLAAAQKVLTKNHIEALAAQRSALNIAQDNYATSIQVANEQWRAADATYNAAVNAANLKANMEGTAAAAGAVAGAMDRVASPSVGGGASVGRVDFGEAGQNAWFMKNFYEATQELNKRSREFTPASFTNAYNAIVNDYLALAEGYNQRKAQERFASAREEFTGGSTERQSAMRSFGQSTSSTAAGAGVSPQVNITTGPVMQMDGTNYVTQRDLVSATGTAARQGAKMALDMLQNNPASRRSTGVTR